MALLYSICVHLQFHQTNGNGNFWAETDEKKNCKRGGEICAMIRKHFTSQSSSRKYDRALERRNRNRWRRKRSFDWAKVAYIAGVNKVRSSV